MTDLYSDKVLKAYFVNESFCKTINLSLALSSLNMPTKSVVMFFINIAFLPIR